MSDPSPQYRQPRPSLTILTIFMDAGTKGVGGVFTEIAPTTFCHLISSIGLITGTLSINSVILNLITFQRGRYSVQSRQSTNTLKEE